MAGVAPRPRPPTIELSDPDAASLLPPQQIKAQIEHYVAVAFAVTLDDLRRPSRGPAEAAFARQIAMYLAHIACGWTFTEVGRLFERDRTTVAHACALIEDSRDDISLDRALEWLERLVRRLASPRRLAREWRSALDDSD
ncbi:MAG TPA: helix-turn-helix domain-containing protein [Hyphomicrobiaceae bacterium]|nr:helix-turn-helix domain-containing protein [Hyphomicrobiaceae bacterium]